MGWRELLDALYRSLPVYSGAARASMWILYPLAFFLFAVTWSLLLLASARLLIRVDPNASWQNRARQTYPPRLVAGMFATTMILTSLVISSMGYLPEYPLPRWLFIIVSGIAAYSGVMLVSPLLLRWAGIAQPPIDSFLRMNASTFGIFLVFYFAGSGVYFAMAPYGPLAGSLAAFLMVVILTKIGMQLAVMWICGMVKRPSERLRRVAADAALESRLGFMPRLCELNTSQANAFAYPGLRLVGVTTRALELFNDIELKGVLHHEFGHLTESRLQRASRFTPLLIYSVFLGSWPAVSTGLHPLSFFPALLAVAFAIKILGSVISRRLEERADAHARNVSAGDEAIYAQALEKIHAANLVPAVMRSAMVTHPSLYDRMTKAGVTPLYERPHPPGRVFKFAGILLTSAATLAFIVCLQLVHYKSTHDDTLTSAHQGRHRAARR